MISLRIVLASTLLAAGLAGSALADTSHLGSGVSNWFYNCANDERMNVVIQHANRSVTTFSLLRGEVVRERVQRGDIAAWSCGEREIVMGDQLRPVVNSR